MRVHLCSIIQTVHYIETQCVLIRHYVAKQNIREQKLHRAKNSINARTSDFKANKLNDEHGGELREIKLKSRGNLQINVRTDTV